MLRNFGSPKDAGFHLKQALDWFAEANARAKKGQKSKWLKAYQEGSKHMWGAIELGVSGARKRALEIAHEQCGKSGEHLS